MASRLGFWIAHACIVGMAIPLTGAFVIQFAQGELPCPLCILQRMAMLLAALGPAFVLARGRHGEITPSDLATGYGMSVLAAVLGLVIASRQVLLHVVPPDEGYGEPVLGLHLYSWSVVIFLIVLTTAGLNLLFADSLAPGKVSLGWPTRAVVGLLAVLIVANFVAVFCEEGFHWTLPDSPTRYQLFHDLGWR
jgi:disulfide bond formation protein DsbB